MYTKGVPKTMVSNSSYPAGFWIHQIQETRSASTVSYYLPHSMSVKIEEKHRTIVTVKPIDALSPLVHNSGLGKGDKVMLRHNNLNLREGLEGTPTEVHPKIPAILP